MRKTSILAALSSLAVLTALTGAGAADAQMGGRMRARMMERLQEKKAEEERPIDLQSILSGVRKQTDAYGADPAQALDVYIPPNARNAPVIVMVHGGAWMIGDKANTGSVENKLEHWLPKGFIVVSVNYRMLPQAMAYDQARDVAQAVRWVQGHAEGWGGDAGKIILMGHSAGAHLVALVSSDPGMVGPRPWAGTVVLDSAAMQVSTIMGRQHPRFYDQAFGSDPAYWAKASPMDQWTPRAVPMMLVCSAKRPDKPCDDARRFQAKVKAAGQDMPVLPQALSHADINRTLGLPGAYTDAVDTFIARRLGR